MRRIVLSAAAWIAGIMILQTAVAAQGDDTAALHAVFEDAWQFTLTEDPLFATRVGDHRFNNRLDDPSQEAARRRADKIRGYLDRLKAIDRSALSPQDRVSYDIFKRLRASDLQEFAFRTYLMPITNRWGFHVQLAQLPSQVPLKTVEDYENYTARLALFKEYADAHIELMRLAIAEGYTLPRVVMDGIETTIEPHIVDDLSKSLLYKPFESFPVAIDEPERERLEAEGRAAIENSVVPGYAAFLEFMKEEYLPAARSTIAASELPDGKAFYEYRVRMYTTLDVTPQEVHDIGVAEVARIRAEMREIIELVEFEGEFEEFVTFLRTDSRFYVDTPEELMMTVSRVLKKMDGELPRLFGSLPRAPYGIKPVPDFIAPKTTTAYYRPPAGDGTRAGFYYVNTYDLRSRPLYEVEALSLHEAVPGHHLQIALQQELEGLPGFRRFSGFTAFSEGWGLYSERLGLEAGFYEDPYSDFGRLTYEMWRACRLVVDTGMHYFGWTRQQAIDFMAANSALTLHNITTEVDRYISWPGQALAYKMGELKIRELRAAAEKRLGSRFDVRGFHDVVLGSGAVPLDVLEANVNRWIGEQTADR